MKNGLTESLLFTFFENAKNLGRSDDAKRRKKKDGLTRVVARFFATGGIIASTKGTSLVVGSGGILPQKILNLEAPKRFFQPLS